MRAAIFAMLFAASAAPGFAAAQPTPPAVKALGPARTCVLLTNIQQTRVVDDRTIDFIMRDGQVLRNNLPNTCAGLKINRSFAYKTSQSQLCNVDIITVVVQGAGPVRGASCGLGSFTPIELPPAK